MSERFPLDPKPGDRWKQWEYTGEPHGWVCVDTGPDAPIHQGGGVWIGPVAPSHPAQGNLWFDGSRMRIWDHGQWVDVVSQGGQGPQGPQGIPGTPGVPGTQGQQGPAGPQGQQGAVGPPGQGISVKGTVATEGDLPSGATVGDLYLDEATGHGWVWNGTTWIDIGQLKSDVPGPQGQQGPQGPQGPAGAASTVPGPPGPSGADGAQGPAGPQGAPGPTGSPGAPGATGPAGPTTLAAMTAAGLGAYLSAQSGYTTSMYSGTSYIIASMLVPAGDWDIAGEVQFWTSGWANYGVIFCQAAISPQTTIPTTGTNAIVSGTFAMWDGGAAIQAIAPWRFQLGGSTNIYLVARIVMPPGAGPGPTYGLCVGRIFARRWG